MVGDAYLKTEKYLRKNGLVGTARRLLIHLDRRFRKNRDVVYWLDLTRRSAQRASTDKEYEVKAYDAISEVGEEFVEALCDEYPSQLVTKAMDARFIRGAILWILTSNGRQIGYTWTLRGAAMKPFYFPLTQRDAHIFDNFLFPAHRGHGKNKYLINAVLDALKTQGIQRAYIETGEWNSAEQKSLSRIGFEILGCATRRVRGSKQMSIWWLDWVSGPNARAGGDGLSDLAEKVPR